MTVFDKGRSRRISPQGVTLLIILALLVLYLVWAILSELSFISTAGQPLLPGEIVEQFRLRDSVTTPITTSGG